MAGIYTASSMIAVTFLKLTTVQSTGNHKTTVLIIITCADDIGQEKFPPLADSLFAIYFIVPAIWLVPCKRIENVTGK